MLGSLDETNVKSPLLSAYNDAARNSSVDFDSICKVIIVGNSGVGKTSLFRRFSDDSFNAEHVSTDAVEFKHRYIDTLSSRCKVQVWDCVTSASKAIITSIYKNTHAIILLFDVSDKQSFEAIQDWMSEIQQYADPTAIIYIVGTKTDLPNRCITKKQGTTAAETWGTHYWELSSLTGAEVDGLFFQIVKNYQDMQTSYLSSSVDSSRQSNSLFGSFRQSSLEKVEGNPSNKSSWCCNCSVS